MSNSREIMELSLRVALAGFKDIIIGDPCYPREIVCKDVGRLLIEPEPTGPKIHLAQNHQDYTPNHRNNGRGKYKRSGR